eukprot:scaffold186478_cov46-Prasinocladus_malaysianus.AAC.1
MDLKYGPMSQDGISYSLPKSPHNIQKPSKPLGRHAPPRTLGKPGGELVANTTAHCPKPRGLQSWVLPRRSRENELLGVNQRRGFVTTDDRATYLALLVGCWRWDNHSLFPFFRYLIIISSSLIRALETGGCRPSQITTSHPGLLAGS